jgi:4-amino-4-deoxychorismate lyase
LTVFVNGQPESQISALDRGLLYGQSLFETIAVCNGNAYLLGSHIDRLKRGCEVLGIPLDIALLSQEINTLIQHQQRAVVRVTLTMGLGGRGYQNPDTPAPIRILSLHPYPDHPIQYWEEGIELGVAEIRLAHQPALAGLKHGNRLEQVIARSQWQQDWQEALLLDLNKLVIEGTQSNVFIVKENELCTPSLHQAGVSGVVRETVISEALKLGMTVKTMSLCLEHIETADEVFLTNSVIGLWPVKKFYTRLYNGFKTTRKLMKTLIKNEAIPNYKT